MKAEEFRAWHWPDHIARKKETRRLREEHNALFNSHARRTELLRRAERQIRQMSVKYGSNFNPLLLADIENEISKETI